MKKNFERWAIRIFSYHLAVLRTKRLSKEDIELTVQIGGGITIAFPLLLVCAVLIIFLTPVLETEFIEVSSIAAVLLIVFGGLRITDKVYDENVNQVRRLVDEIRLRPKGGTWWAVRQLSKLYLGYFATAGIVSWLSWAIFR